jgi:hypothetical protein
VALSLLFMPSRSAVPNEVGDASLTLGRTKNGGSAGQKMGARQDKKWGLGTKTKEGLIGRTIIRTHGRTM